MKKVRTRIAGGDPSYLVSAKPNLKFIHSGCTGLDCILGGGYALGRISNIVGDKSTAKTALATEALINFIIQYPKGVGAYREREYAFDREYAAAMGLPIDKIDFGPEEGWSTVEEFAKDFDKYLAQCTKEKRPGLYVLDSLDSLSDEAEMKRDVGDATYGTAKAKALSEFFRKTAAKIESSRVHLMVISQVRDNIGAMFGEKHKRSGGRALDFYSSQIIWLSHMGFLNKTIKKVRRPYGIEVKAKCKKNKVGLPFREFEFDFIFGYGVDDLAASISWLDEVGRVKEITNQPLAEYVSEVNSLDDEAYKLEKDRVNEVVKTVWAEIETTFLPKRRKYG
jgi:protein RecA